MDGQDAQTLFKELLNIVEMHRAIDDLIQRAASSGSFSLSEALIKSIHGIGMNGLLAECGNYRTKEVHITNSAHIPPSWVDVEAYMGALCRYVQDNWQDRSLTHLSAMVLWRLNWIHPFRNGNGRTARAVAYLVLCARHGKALPMKKQASVYDFLNERKQDYYVALGKADETYKHSHNIELSVQPVEALLSQALLYQLSTAFAN